MLKSFDKYILKEVGSPFLIGLFVYTLTLLINNILLLSNALISRGASYFTVFKIFIYLIPDILTFTIPMSTLMGVLAGFSRMSGDSEIIAFRTMGINNKKLLKPVVIFSLFTWIITTILIMFVAPETNFRLSKQIQQVFLSKTIKNIKPGIFYRNFPGYILYFKDIDQRSNEWKDVFLYSFNNGDYDTVITADRGLFLQDKTSLKTSIVLKNAYVHTFKINPPKKQKSGDIYSIYHYNYLREKIKDFVRIKQTRRSTQLIITDLIKKKKENPENILYQIEFQRKFTLPFACIALAFLGLPLGLSTKKGGKISGFIISLAIIFVYYTIITTMRNIVLKKILPPFIGMWLPNLFLIGIGIAFYIYSSQEASFNYEKLLKPFYKIRKKIISMQLFDSKLKIIKRMKLAKILDWYIIKKIFLTFIMVFISLLMIFYIINIIELIDDIIENKVAFFYIFKYVYYNTPNIIGFIIPVSVLTSVLLTYSVMSKNNEIIAIKVSGISLYRLTLPAIIFGIILSLLSFYLQEKIIPDYNKKARETLNIIRNIKVNTEIEYRDNWAIDRDNRIFFYSAFLKNKDIYIKFNLLSMNQNFEVKERIFAKSAKKGDNNKLILQEGFVRKLKNNESIDYYRFKNMLIKFDESIFKRKITRSEFMNISDLKKYIKHLKKRSADTRRYEAEIYHKLAFPFTSLIMVLIAIPFSFSMGKKGALFGIGIAVGISMLFWSLTGIFNSMGTSGLISPFLSGFAPVFLFTLISLYLYLSIKT